MDPLQSTSTLPVLALRDLVKDADQFLVAVDIPTELFRRSGYIVQPTTLSSLVYFLSHALTRFLSSNKVLSTSLTRAPEYFEAVGIMQPPGADARQSYLQFRKLTESLRRQINFDLINLPHPELNYVPFESLFSEGSKAILLMHQTDSQKGSEDASDVAFRYFLVTRKNPK